VRVHGCGRNGRNGRCSAETFNRCFVHIANSLVWRQLTGENPPMTPLTAKEYEQAGLPWFEFYDADAKVLEGAASFENVKSVEQRGNEVRQAPLPENESIEARNVVTLRRGLRPNEVRDGVF